MGRLLLTAVALIFHSLALFPQTEQGKATFYAKKFHARKTASGIRLNNQGYQAAHRTLPFGSWVKVSYPKKKTVVFVEIVDRGPFRKGRIIDLTYAAAERLNFIRSGVADVEVSPAGNIDWLLTQSPILPHTPHIDVVASPSPLPRVAPPVAPHKATPKKRKRWRIF